MKKVEIMDEYFDSHQGKITSYEICSIVRTVFDLDLVTKPILGEMSSSENKARMAIDSSLAQYEKDVSGAEIRKLINQIFGINLDAVSSLDGSRISLFSKDQWINRQDRDLFVVHTGPGDVDVMIYPTDYFIERTGLKELPEDLKQALINLEFYYDNEVGHYYYADAHKNAVPDAFKGQTIGAILKVIRQSYQNL
ncbi:hypothetical protein SAMN04489762_0948 [Terribacillus saccharophilus]|uniref:Uncharacterized protein n=1 Tax=Terribacillus saccharophilus TaxID=361277 RepID=A0AAX2ECT5_9BACI|nr:hypothetical protein SAMN04489762_0948 [Terribacillus saccharophilus]